MAVHARKARPDATQDRYAAESVEEPVLRPREVLETLETSRYVDDDIDGARGFVNAAIIGTLFWALIIVMYSILA